MSLVKVGKLSQVNQNQDLYLEDGKLMVEIDGSIGGIQKTQIVDSSDNPVGVENDALNVNIKGLSIPDSISGNIDLASSLHIPGSAGQRLSYGQAIIQMLSANISVTTTFYLEFSLDQTNWDIAVEGGVDVSDTLVQSQAKVFPFESPNGLYWRIRFASGSTGTVNYVILG